MLCEEIKATKGFLTETVHIVPTMKKICIALNILVLCFSSSCREDPVTPLDRPVNLTASKGTFKDKILVEWTPMPGAENYEVYRATLAKNEYVKVSEGQ